MSKEVQAVIDGLAAENESLNRILIQLDPTDKENYDKVRDKIAQNAAIIADLQAKETEQDLKKKEIRAKVILGVISVGGIALEIFLRTKATKDVLGTIYGYETEALMPQAKVQMATRFMNDKLTTKF